MRYLTREQRYTISAMYKQGCTQKMIAQAIGKDKLVVSRELKRNRNEKGKYTFSYAVRIWPRFVRSAVDSSGN